MTIITNTITNTITIATAIFTKTRAITNQVSDGGTKTFRHFKSSKDISWEEAKKLCQKERGGRLATIMSEAEQLAVRQNLPMSDAGGWVAVKTHFLDVFFQKMSSTQIHRSLGWEVR